jgi:hypothetical protein
MMKEEVNAVGPEDGRATEREPCIVHKMSDASQIKSQGLVAVVVGVAIEATSSAGADVFRCADTVGLVCSSRSLPISDW